MKFIWLLLVFFIGIPASQYGQDVETWFDQDGRVIRIWAKNNSQHPQEVTVSLNKADGLRGNRRPQKQIVPAGESVEIKNLLIEKEGYNLDYRYEWRKPDAYVQQQYEKRIAQLKEKLDKQVAKLAEDYDLENGIVVFNKDGCPRCYRTTSYLLDNDIDFTLINVKDSRENNLLMWRGLKENGVTDKELLMPVVLVNGKLSHTHKDLVGFLKTLN